MTDYSVNSCNFARLDKNEEKMEDNFEHVVYSKNIIEFVTVANEFCTLLESSSKLSKKEFLHTAQKIVPLLYLKATMLPKVECELEDAVEKFVSEGDWEFIRSQVKIKLGQFDEYLEVFDAQMQQSEEPLTQTVSENFADIYQHIKDFLMVYRLGTIELMNDSLVDLQSTFEQEWGQNLVNTLRAIHNTLYSDEEYADELDQEDEDLDDNDNLGGSIFSQRKKEWGLD